MLEAGIKVEGNCKVSNHSARKTMIQKLKNEHVPDTDIIQLTGHKNIQSLNAYSSLNLERQKEISNMLSDNPDSDAINFDADSNPDDENMPTAENPAKRYSRPTSVLTPVVANVEEAEPSMNDISLSSNSMTMWSSSIESVKTAISRPINEAHPGVGLLSAPCKASAAHLSLFQNANISGGHINVYNYTLASPVLPLRKRIKRPIIDSDSDSQSQ